MNSPTNDSQSGFDRPLSGGGGPRRHDYPGKLIVIEGTDGVGRSTQAELLRNWLAIEGHGVTVTEWKSSRLMGEAIDKAKSKNALNTITFSLLYATDLADRLHNIIVPALKAGLIVIVDRYYYTAFARDVVRGADPSWVTKLYGFAIEPDLVFYLKMPLEPLLKRIITTRGSLDFYESGRDIGMSNDLYQSFKLYQSQILLEYDRMIARHSFKVVPADDPIEQVQKQLRQEMRQLLAASDARREQERDQREPADLESYQAASNQRYAEAGDVINVAPPGESVHSA